MSTDQITPQEKPRKEKCVRWRKTAIDQLGYTLNLVFTLTIAALAYFFGLLRDKEFKPVSSAKCALFIALLLLLVASFSGLLCIINRLLDIRGTARRACNDVKAPSQHELHDLGNKTWILFWVLLGAFVFGVIALAAALLLTDGYKLI